MLIKMWLNVHCQVWADRNAWTIETFQPKTDLIKKGFECANCEPIKDLNDWRINE